jgi:hypothetical protein
VTSKLVRRPVEASMSVEAVGQGQRIFAYPKPERWDLTPFPGGGGEHEGCHGVHPLQHPDHLERRCSFFSLAGSGTESGTGSGTRKGNQPKADL